MVDGRLDGSEGSLPASGCRVTVAGFLRGEEGVRQGVEFRNIGENYKYRELLKDNKGQHRILVASARADVLDEANQYPFEARILWLHVDRLDVVRRSPQRR